MVRSLGIFLSSIASVILVILIFTVFAEESFGDIMLYYGFNTANPLLAGAYALGVLVIFAAVRSGRLSEPTGTGVALGLGLVCLLIVTVWVFTGRVDVFLAPSWAFTVHRWSLVGVSLLVVIGAALHAWKLGLLSSGR